MTQEDKNLLLRDLCARLPYGVKLWHESYVDFITLHSIDATHCGVEISIDSSDSDTPWWNSIEQVKPYLFPLSSMTEEQKRKYNSLRNFVPTYHYEYGDIVEDTELYDNWESIDYLIANHFDYRGLIEMGLAIDATGLNIYINHDTGR